MWFVAKLVFAICSDGYPTGEIDEQVRLFTGNDTAEVKRKALKCMDNEAAEFTGGSGVVMQWKPVACYGVWPLDEFSDGMEITSCISKPQHLMRYIAEVSNRSEICLTPEERGSAVLSC